MTQTRIRAAVAAGLVLLGVLGVVSPDSETNEELVDTIVAGVGAVVALFTPSVK